MSDLLSLDATAQIQALATRRVSAVELLEMAVRRHEQVRGQINAVVALDLERARSRARAIDEQRAKGDHLGALAGLPMTIKDTFDVEGMPASSGLKALRGRLAKDAAVVLRAKHDGAVIWGKTNIPVLAGDWQSYNDLYGTTNNPWALDAHPRRLVRRRGGGAGDAASPRWRSARTSAARCGCRRASAASIRTSRPGAWSPSAAMCRPRPGPLPSAT